MDPRRFWDRVLIGDGCWPFTTRLNRQGYGRYGNALAHRVAWELWTGETLRPYPDEVVCHRCDNPSCVRPDHLFVGTQADNIRDAQRKGRLSPAPHGPRERCRRGHLFAEHAIMRRQGRLCGVCDAEREARRRAV